jgi:ubiquinone/menaquinone biosynthesis C-methylase UbiE
MTTQRWNEAQQCQKKFWQARASMTHINEKFWAKMINRGLDLNYEFFTNKDVLEVGCGATGIIFFLENTKSKIGIEPMDISDLINNNNNDDWKKQFVRKGVGEQLPFENNSFDIVICFSVLDQVIDPAKLIQEVHRVLRDKGEFLLWFQSLRSQYKYLKHILNKADSLRPHHFTLNEILTVALKNNYNNNFFEVRKKNASRGLGLRLNLYLPISRKRIKNLIGTIMTNNVWLWLRKVE